MLSAMRLLGHGLGSSLVVIVLGASACGDDGSAEGSTSITAGSTGVTAGSTDTTASPVSLTSADSTTGAEMRCNGWSEDDRDGPWLELQGEDGEPLAPGGVLGLLCGGQGSWMFPIYPTMGGWEPSDLLSFSVVVEVEGFAGPFGPFYDEGAYSYDIGCIEEDTDFGGFSHDCLAVLPPDDTQLPMIDGAPATVHVELSVDGGDPLVIDVADLTISAPADLLAIGCTL